jgi:hypothetical protein
MMAVMLLVCDDEISGSRRHTGGEALEIWGCGIVFGGAVSLQNQPMMKKVGRYCQL